MSSEQSDENSWVLELEKSYDVRSFYAEKLADLAKEQSRLLVLQRALASSPLRYARMDDVADPVDLRDIPYNHIKKLLTVVERDIRRFTAKLRRANNIPPPKDTFDLDLLKQVPIELLLQSPPKTSQSHRITTLCPFHQEKSPSFVIFKDKNTFHCFGCQAHGTSIDFVMLSQKIPFKSACKFLASFS